MEKIYALIQDRRLRRRSFRRSCLMLTLIIFAGLQPQTLSANNSHPANDPLQGVSVAGKVTEESGAPLPGVNILEKGTGY